MGTIEPWMLFGVWSAMLVMWWIAICRPKGFALSVIARVPGVQAAELTVRVAPVTSVPADTADSTEATPDVEP